MAERAAIVTGASSGIGLAIARMLGEEGFGITMAARRQEKLDGAVSGLASDGFDAHGVAANVADESEIEKVVAAHRERYGRLDVLVNNAGIGIGAQVGEIQTKRLDMQLDINLRAIILFYRACLDMLQAAGAEHKNALVVNTSSIAGKRGEGWLSVYAAAKHGVVGWTQSMNRELSTAGIKSTALCPAFVDTPMTDFVKEHVKPEEMIRPEDIAESVRFLLRVSPACVVPEMMFIRPGDELQRSHIHGPLVTRSLLHASQGEVWAGVTTVAAINDEFWPLFRMTAPARLRDQGLESVVTGQRACRSWVLVLGLLPIDYDDITLVRIDPPNGFLERSQMLSQRVWEHERTLEQLPDGCRLTDSVRFQPRLPVHPRVLLAIYAFVFRHRHRRLRLRFGGRPLPLREG